MNCVVCGRPIPALRYEMQPRVKTCGRECQTTNRRRLNRDANRAYRARERRKRADGTDRFKSRRELGE